MAKSGVPMPDYSIAQAERPLVETRGRGGRRRERDDYLRTRGEASLYEVSMEARKNLLQQLLSGLSVAVRTAADLANLIPILS